MPPLQNIFRRLSAFASPWKTNNGSNSPGTPSRDSAQLLPGQLEPNATLDIEQGMTGLVVDKKRKFKDSVNTTSSKRHKQNGRMYTPEMQLEQNSESGDVGENHHAEGVARTTMLPPITPGTPGQRLRVNRAIRKSLDTGDKHLRGGADTDSTFSVKTGTTTLRSPEHYDQYTMEQARRHAAAVQLPANSGVWDRSEQELFYHLALRGFEPLLPPTWMLDFKTLPLSLYTRQDTDDTPVITNLYGTEFRAIRALRDLIETGKNIRDKTLTSPGVHIESTLSRAFNTYLSWAVTDAGIRNKSQALPVHSTILRRKGQSTAETIAELATRLHTLAARHRKKRGIYPSIESHQTSGDEHDNNNRTQTQVLNEHEDGLPILTGIAIVSSVLAVFTFNAHTPPPSSLLASIFATSPSTTIQQQQEQNQRRNSTGHTEDSGLRFIATFDFSEAAHDVWNALAVALVAVHIRKIMLESLVAQQEDGDVQMAMLDRDGGYGHNADDDDDYDDDPDR